MQKSALAAPLLDKDDQADDAFMWVRLIATVTAVSLGSSLQFGFATGSLNNLEQVRAARAPERARAAAAVPCAPLP